MAHFISSETHGFYRFDANDAPLNVPDLLRAVAAHIEDTHEVPDHIQVASDEDGDPVLYLNVKEIPPRNSASSQS